MSALHWACPECGISVKRSVPYCPVCGYESGAWFCIDCNLRVEYGSPKCTGCKRTRQEVDAKVPSPRERVNSDDRKPYHQPPKMSRNSPSKGPRARPPDWWCVDCEFLVFGSKPACRCGRLREEGVSLGKWAKPVDRFRVHQAPAGPSPSPPPLIPSMYGHSQQPQSHSHVSHVPVFDPNHHQGYYHQGMVAAATVAGHTGHHPNQALGHPTAYSGYTPPGHVSPLASIENYTRSSTSHDMRQFQQPVYQTIYQPPRQIVYPNIDQNGAHVACEVPAVNGRIPTMPAYAPSHYPMPMPPKTSASDSNTGDIESQSSPSTQEASNQHVPLPFPSSHSPGSVANNYKETWIMFKERMNNSYRVELTDNFPFNNARGPHVETPINGLTGMAFRLDLKSRNIKITDASRNLIAVMYDVLGLEGAHFTNYHGPIAGSDMY